MKCDSIKYLFFIFFLMTMIGCSQNEKILKEAQEFYSKEKYDSALLKIQEIQTEDITEEAKYLKAKVLTQLYSYEESIVILKSLKKIPKDSVYKRLALCFFNFAKHDHSKEYLLDSSLFYINLYINLNPADFNVQNLKGRALHNKGDYYSALQHYYKLNKIFPSESYKIRLDIATEKCALSDNNGALQELLELKSEIKKSDKSDISSQLFRWLSIVYFEKGIIDSALFYINQSIILSKDDNQEFLYETKAEILWSKGLKDSACVYYYMAAEKGFDVEKEIISRCAK